jgi:hypothetical protein
MAATPPHAFLSYTRLDDECQAGGITRCAPVERGVRVVTARPLLHDLPDVDGIECRPALASRLDEALAQARIRIPVLEPELLRAGVRTSCEVLELERRAAQD